MSEIGTVCGFSLIVDLHVLTKVISERYTVKVLTPRTVIQRQYIKQHHKNDKQENGPSQR